MALDDDDGERKRKSRPSAARMNGSRQPTASLLGTFLGFRDRSIVSTALDQHAAREHERRNRARGRVRQLSLDGDGERDRNKRNYPRPQPEFPAKLVRIDIKALDPRYPDLELPVRPGDPVWRLEHRILRALRELDISPLKILQLKLFTSDRRELTQDDVFPTELPRIWYRMGQAEDRWFTHRGKNYELLNFADTLEITMSIKDGATVRQLRRLIADRWKIDDPNRVILIAKEGFRPGSLKGNDWVVKEIMDKWLCRQIAFEICQKKRYYVFKGLRREYVLHPEEACSDVWGLMSALREKVFLNVGQHHGEGDLDLPTRKINILHEGKPARHRIRPAWASEYTFDILSTPAAEAFSNEEAWLLPTNVTCVVCLEDKKASDLPVRVTAGCKHESNMCKACLDQWLASSLKSGTWERLRCPECPELLQHEDVHRYASQATFSRYDHLATRALLKDIPNFRWCLSTKCTSGQIDDANCPKFKCKGCKKSHCTKHNVPWHEGETCQEYDKRHKKRLKEDKASEETIKQTSKQCPECKRNVQKYTGCNHITCLCGHEWCYICFAGYQHNPVGLLYCRHNPGCSEIDPFLDAVEPRGQQHQEPQRTFWEDEMQRQQAFWDHGGWDHIAQVRHVDFFEPPPPPPPPPVVEDRPMRLPQPQHLRLQPRRMAIIPQPGRPPAERPRRLEPHLPVFTQQLPPWAPPPPPPPPPPRPRGVPGPPPLPVIPNPLYQRRGARAGAPEPEPQPQPPGGGVQREQGQQPAAFAGPRPDGPATRVMHIELPPRQIELPLVGMGDLMDLYGGSEHDF